MKNKVTATKPAQPETVVYCGPTLRGIAKQYTPFTDGLPESLRQQCEKIPLLHELIVPIDQLSATKSAINTFGSKARMVYDRCKDLVEGRD